MALLARTAAILLAAGQSQRHPGQSKLYRALNGQALGLHAAQTLAELAPAVMIAICSAHTHKLSAEFAELGFEVVWNDDPGKGLSSSLAQGVLAARQHDVDAVLICLADMPFVGVAHLRALISRLDNPAGITVVGSRAKHTRTTMPPAVFGGEMLDRLLALEGDVGARQLLRHAVSIEVPLQDLADFDDPSAFDQYNASTSAKP